MTAPSALAQDVVRAFRYLLSSQEVRAEEGVEMARLMLELASTRQLEDHLRAQPDSDEARRQLQECRQRAGYLATRLGLDAPAAASEAAAR